MRPGTVNQSAENRVPLAKHEAIARRAEILRRRATRDAEEIDEASRALARVLERSLHFVVGTRSVDRSRFPVVASYRPIRGEIDPGPVIELLRPEAVVLPRVDGDAMTMRRWPARVDEVSERVHRPLERSALGFEQPPISAPTVGLAEIDVVLVPLSAFDDSLNRLGYGRGHYDRWLADATRRPTLLGLAYEDQLLPRFTPDATDVALDWVCSPVALRDATGVRGR